MSRKIFLSFLGTSIYKETYYIATDQNEETVVPTRFIQEATVRNFCRDYVEGDKIIIFTTKGALSNWEDQGHFDSRSKETVLYEPLKNRLESLNLNCSIENIEIKDGKTPNELWEIFSVVFGSIEQNDQITFDITHGFRFLPMLNMVLINYAKLLRNISVLGIYYGNWEAQYQKDNKTFSPIWDLKDFEELQDWTNSANIFLSTGNALPLSKLIQSPKNQDIKNGLEFFSKQILVNRGMDLIDGQEIIKLRKALENIKVSDQEGKSSPLVPILDKIKYEFDGYKRKNFINGFLAVKWATENGLIQQGATLLEEAITTFVLFEIKQADKINDKDIRMTVSAALSIGNDTEFNFKEIPPQKQVEKEKDIKKRLQCKEQRKWQKKYVPIIQESAYKKRLGNCITSIKTSIRNDINHAGFRENPRSYDDFKKSLIKRYNEVRKFLLSEKGIELPDFKN